MSSGGLIAAVIFAGVASVAGGIIQGNAAKAAAKANAAAQREAIASQERQATANRAAEEARQEQIRADSLAQIEIGQQATRTLAGTATEDGDILGGSAGLGLSRTFEDERADFLVGEGERSINRALAARGQSLSGAALEAIGRNTTDIRTDSTQREQDLLLNLSTLGANTAQGLATNASNLTANTARANTALTGQTSNSLASIGSGNAQGISDRGTALAGIGTGIGNAALTGVAVDVIVDIVAVLLPETCIAPITVIAEQDV